MSDEKTSGLAAHNANPATGDLFMIVDVSDTSMAITGTNKYLPASYVSIVTRTETLTNKTLTTPTIADFSNAGHTHQNAAGGGQLDHGAALTGLSDDDHTQYLLATGTRDGASSQAQTFTNGIVGPSWQPASDSTTAIQVKDAAGANSILVGDTGNKRVGINATPEAALHISTEETSVSYFDIYNASITSVPIIQRAARGTKASPTAVQSGDTLFGFAGRGYGATGFSSGARAVVAGAAAENWTDTEQGAHLRFLVTAAGGTSVTERMRLHNSGFLGLGTTVPVGHLAIAGNFTVSAWGTAGIVLEARAATFTDSSTASSGTATNAVANSFGQPTFAASNTTVTMTNAATVYIAAAPTAGTNVTLTNAYALWVDDGAVRLDGNIGFFAKAPAAQQTSGADLTNNVASGGTDDTIANYTDLTTYATDAAAIRNNIYQLARKLKQINDGLRLYGLFT